MRKLFGWRPQERRRDLEKRAVYARIQELERRVALIEREIALLRR